jgi:hypothetical protein
MMVSAARNGCRMVLRQVSLSKVAGFQFSIFGGTGFKPGHWQRQKFRRHHDLQAKFNLRLRQCQQF